MKWPESFKLNCRCSPADPWVYHSKIFNHTGFAMGNKHERKVAASRLCGCPSHLAIFLPQLRLLVCAEYIISVPSDAV